MRLLVYFFVTVTVFSNLVYSDYIAAVVEHAPSNGTSPNRTIISNLNEYLYRIGLAKSSQVQIIVFPEYGLTGLIDDPTEYGIEIPEVGAGPAFQNHVLQSLANAALENSMYIVFNIAEKAKNAKNGTVYYNTNVVFDKQSKIVAKYRKINLYEEPLFTPGNVEENKHVTFYTDFGVTFGTFICFDISFYTPSRSVLNTTTVVTDIVYPTAWYSALPFYHSLSYHYGYAVENKVNLLAANINNLKEGQGGSGIYGADGTVYTYTLAGFSEMLIAKVSTERRMKSTGPNYRFDLIDNPDAVNTLSFYNISRIFVSSKYRFVDLNVSQSVNISQSACDSTFCCHFSISTASNNSNAVYKLMAFRGSSLLSPSVSGNIKVCSLLACETTDPATCATRNVKETIRFNEIAVRTEVNSVADEYYVPVTLMTNLLPLFNTTYRSAAVNGTRHLSLRTGKPEEGVLVFGIYGNGASSVAISGGMVVLLVVVKYFTE